MIRVLHSVSYMHRAGVETFLMNYYKNIDRSLVQFDFLCNKQMIGDYDEEIRHLGGRIFYRPNNGSMAEAEYASFWKKFIGEHPEIQILHAHNGAKQAFPLEGAQLAGLPIRIAHAHSTDFVHDEKYLRRLELIRKIPTVANYYFGCSKQAGEFFFGSKLWEENGVQVRNAIPCRLFEFNQIIRNEIRAKLDIEKKFVVGHVGRFMKQKNHVRLLEIFSDLCKIRTDARLLLIGAGELEEEIKSYAISLGINNRVIFCGEQEEMYKWYQAMDIYVMPSLFEGLTLSGIEAQASGLPCIFSDAVSKETKVTDHVRFVSLNSDNSIWCANILDFLHTNRVNNTPKICAAGYDIELEAVKLQNLYISLVEQLA